jgi:D-alanyl-D-alanine carboxypeptidase (penicillin-binding protein 5/6)
VKLRLLAVCAALVFSAPAVAAAPEVSARAYRLENAATGEVLLRHADRARVPIASITKLMTVLVTLEHAKPGDVVAVSSGASEVGESSVNLRPGERITVRDLLQAALIQSANDAADALADYVGHGDRARFVAMMNSEARRLGLADTHFSRPDGLDAAGHLSSARDVTLLAEVAMHSPLVRSIVRRRTASIAGGRTLHTWNDLLGRFPGLIGVKTGHTGAAGWCEVGAARGPRLTVYAAVLGSPSRSQRNADLAALLRYGLSRYRVVQLVEPHKVYAHVRTEYGRKDVPLVAETPVSRAVRVDRPLVQRVVAAGAVKLPVVAGDRLGLVRVVSGGRLVAESPLVAAKSVNRPGLAGRAGWYAKRTVHHLAGLFPL